MPVAEPGRVGPHHAGVAVLLCLGAWVFPGAEGAAQDATATDATGKPAFLAEVLRDLSAVEEKTLALADALTQEQYDWRPSEGVRSAGEVFMHIAAINLAFPLMTGHAPAASTGMTLENLAATAPAYEGSQTDRDPIRDELRASFESLRAAIGATASSSPERPIRMFGGTTTLRAFWNGHAGHLHEHLGQLIAYARMNGVVPPWSGP